MYIYLVTKELYFQEQNFFESHLFTLKREVKLSMISVVPSQPRSLWFCHLGTFQIGPTFSFQLYPIPLCEANDILELLSLHSLSYPNMIERCQGWKKLMKKIEIGWHTKFFLPPFFPYLHIVKYQKYKDKQDKASLSFIQANLDHELPPPIFCLSKVYPSFKGQFKPHLLLMTATHTHLSNHTLVAVFNNSMWHGHVTEYNPQPGLPCKVVQVAPCTRGPGWERK